MDWTSPLHFVDANGEDVESAKRLEQALDAHGVRGLRPALVTAGVPHDAQALPALDEVPDDDADALIAVWPDLYRGWRLYDAFLTSERLVPVRQRRRWGHSVRRGIAAKSPLFHARVRRDTVARLSAVLSVPLSEAGRSAGPTPSGGTTWRSCDWVGGGGVGLAGSALRIPGHGQPWDRLKSERGGTATEVEEMVALLRRLVGDRLQTKAKA